ncbi:MAG: AAA family ATPase [Gammaproteobacteria bacterium]
MRVVSLYLERYGTFSDRKLSFPESGLCLIYGTNEAGKTTALTALSDLLYGFPHLTPYDFQFDAKHLRLGATVVNRAGAELCFRRRKGRTRTLLSPRDQELGDDSLAPFIGRSDRGLFEKAFGLSHGRLREGGEAMLGAGGDIGESLIEAGSGISNLLEIQRLLQSDADKLYGERKVASKAIYRALDGYEEARTALRKASLGVDEWRRAVQERAGAEEQLEHIRQAVAEAKERAERLARLRRVLPVLRQIDYLSSRLAELGDTSMLPKNAAQRRVRALELRTRAAQHRDRAKERIEAVDTWLADHTVPEGVLDRAEEIERLHNQRGRIQSYLQEVPTLQAEARTERRRVSDYACRLGLNDARTVTGSRLDDIRLTRFEKLIHEGERLSLAGERARGELAAAQASLNETLEALRPLADTQDPSEHVHRVARLRAVEDDELELHGLQERCDSVQRELADAVAKLPLWRGTVDALFQTALPLRVTLNEFVSRFARIEQNRQAVSDQLQAAAAAIEQTQQRLDSLQAAGEVPTMEALFDARARRQYAWSVIRRRYIDGGSLDEAPPTSLDGKEPLDRVYETLVLRADNLADRRQAETQRITEHSAAVAAIAAAKRARQEATLRLEKLEHKATGLSNDWRQIWTTVAIEPQSPEAMLDWLEQVEGLRQLAGRHTEIARQSQRLERRIHEATAAAAALQERVGIQAPAATLRETLDRIAYRLEARAARWRRAQELRAQQADREKTSTRLAKQSLQIEEAAAKWQARWQQFLVELGHPPTLTTSEARTALSLWRDLYAAEAKADDLQRRAQEMEQTCERFSATATALAIELLPEASAQVTLELVDALFARLREAEKLAVSHTEHRQQRREWKQQLADANDELRAAHDELAALLVLGKITDEALLEREIKRAEEQCHLQEKLSATRDQLISAGDGYPEVTLRQLSSNWEAAALEQAEMENADTLRRLETAHEEASRELERKEVALRELRSKSNAEAAAQDMQCALAELSIHANDWAQLRCASIMLKIAIDRFRQKHQSPLLARAGELFSHLTAGSFSHFAVDYDENDEPRLVGERPNGERVTIAGMSDGTRDQLYLALRISALEAYCEKEEPLPFVGDDLFIHFDDERAAAGLRLLGTLTSCQVLLFTHHRHLVQLAERSLGNQCHVVPL